MELAWFTAIALLVVASILWLLRARFSSPSSKESYAGRPPAGSGVELPNPNAGSELTRPQQPQDLLQKFGISITATTDPELKRGTAENVDLGDLEATPDGGWILNPKSSFPLTLYGSTKDVVLNLKILLDDSCVGSWNELLPKISGLFCQANLRCKEIETYIQTQKAIYFQRIKELKESSLEWRHSSERDQLDLLEEFRRVAIEHLRVKPQADLKVLFEGQPKDMSVDDKLIGKYGYDVTVFFLKRAPYGGKLYVIPADHYDRRNWEKLTELGIASRGDDIPLTTILSALTLKKMAELVEDLKVPRFIRGPRRWKCSWQCRT
ncbi:MAG: hypothetical protein HY046_11785 [Acidobacteria bacterium]|nr:hypothetical protein [Acidobacteriota bacterium]